MQRENGMYPALGTRTMHPPPEMAAPTSPTHLTRHDVSDNTRREKEVQASSSEKQRRATAPQPCSGSFMDTRTGERVSVRARNATEIGERSDTFCTERPRLAHCTVHARRPVADLEGSRTRAIAPLASDVLDHASPANRSDVLLGWTTVLGWGRGGRAGQDTVPNKQAQAQGCTDHRRVTLASAAGSKSVLDVVRLGLFVGAAATATHVHPRPFLYSVACGS